MTIPPIAFRWDGESMIPLHPKLADKHYVIGEAYRLEHREERSSATHAHYFAVIAEAHANLPDDLAERFATPEHLRKFALIRCGYRDERTITCSSKAEAQRLAGFIKPMDEFAVVVPIGAAVTVYTAKSQSMRAMGKQEFAASKEAVLTYLAQMIGTTPEALSKAEAA